MHKPVRPPYPGLPDINLRLVAEKLLGTDKIVHEMREVRRLSYPDMLRTWDGPGALAPLRDLRGIGNFENLEELDLTGCEVGLGPNGIFPLEHLQRLEVLVLRDCAIPDITALSTLHALRRLDLGKTPDSPTNTCPGNLKPLARLKRLEYLSLAEQRNLGSLKGIGGCTALRELDVRNTSIQALDPLAGLPNLEVLHLQGTPPRDLAPLTTLPRLRELDIRGCKHLRDGAALARIPTLQALRR